MIRSKTEGTVIKHEVAINGFLWPKEASFHIFQDDGSKQLKLCNSNLAYQTLINTDIAIDLIEVLTRFVNTGKIVK